MRVLLIQPPYDLHADDERQAMPPLGLAYIAATLQGRDHEVQIIDCVADDFHRLKPLADGRCRQGLDDEQIKQRIRAFDPQLVGVSCLFSAQSSAAHHVCRLVKQVNPSIRTIMGGAHPSAVPEEVLADPAVDMAAIGEGELTMLRLAEAGDQDTFTLGNPSGLAFCRNGSVQINRPTEYLADLDELPMPARHLLPMTDYFKYRSPHGAYVKRHPCTNMITSRGCPGRCVFCSIHTVWGRKYRWHSTARVIAEIEHLIDHYGVREIQFEDDNLTLHKQRMTEICQAIIERDLDILWTTPNGVAIWALDEKLIELMRRAGCYHITLAVESGRQEVLKTIIHKPLDLGRVHPVVQACKRLGMGVSAFFVVGFPGETKADITQTFDFAMGLGVDQACFFTATPYPGTALFQQCLDAGLLTKPVNYSELRVGKPLINTPDWSADLLLAMTQEAQARFYRQVAWQRPSRFLVTGLKKLLREPRVTMHKARQAFLPLRRDLPAPASTAACEANTMTSGLSRAPGRSLPILERNA